MKTRTIEELHDKEIGHKKFANVCDLILENGHSIKDIKEYNEKFKFYVDGFLFEYSKEWKASAKEYYDYLLNILNFKKDLSIIHE